MDPVLDRMRAADPVSEADFAGRADFDALVARLEPSSARRRRLRLLAVPALSAIVAALAILPGSAPQASEILQRATEAVSVDDGILYARSHVRFGPTGGGPTRSRSRQIWVLGDTAMRWREDGGAEEVYRKGEGTSRRDPKTGEIRRHPEARMIPNEIFRAGALLRGARAGTNVRLDGEATVHGRRAYVLRWRERSGPPHWPAIEMTMWVDTETYVPLRFSDHSYGKAADGSPFDQTYTEDVLDFRRLPDTPENRELIYQGTVP